jgi:hypothetical protein
VNKIKSRNAVYARFEIFDGGMHATQFGGLVLRCLASRIRRLLLCHLRIEIGVCVGMLANIRAHLRGLAHETRASRSEFTPDDLPSHLQISQVAKEGIADWLLEDLDPRRRYALSPLLE